MLYKSVIFSLNPLTDEHAELLIALLDSKAYEGVFQEDDQVTAYISEEFYDEQGLAEICGIIESQSCKIIWRVEDIPEQNWNAIWESNFEPVIIDKRCAIRAPFHSEFPECKYQITIEPKMSFGTGHHHTTRMILEQMLDMNFSGKSVLDMGCGTGVLGILATLLGSNLVTAIDNDHWAYENTIENTERNTSVPVKVIQGSSDAIPQEQYDFILANINRNILLDQMPDYASHTCSGSVLFLSGLMLLDVSMIRESAESEGFTFLNEYHSGQWALLIFKRN